LLRSSCLYELDTKLETQCTKSQRTMYKGGARLVRSRYENMRLGKKLGSVFLPQRQTWRRAEFKDAQSLRQGKPDSQPNCTTRFTHANKLSISFQQKDMSSSWANRCSLQPMSASSILDHVVRPAMNTFPTALQ
jgi:hypothetical protein